MWGVNKKKLYVECLDGWSSLFSESFRDTWILMFFFANASLRDCILLLKWVGTEIMNEFILETTILFTF